MHKISKIHIWDSKPLPIKNFKYKVICYIEHHNFGTHEVNILLLVVRPQDHSRPSRYAIECGQIDIT
jgi:hypothetical protein